MKYVFTLLGATLFMLIACNNNKRPGEVIIANEDGKTNSPKEPKSSVLTEDSLLQIMNEAKDFDSTVANNIRLLLSSLAQAKVLKAPTLQRPVMVWNLFDINDPTKESIYHMSKTFFGNEKILTSRNREKNGTLVLVSCKKGSKSGFYTNGADRYEMKFTTYFVSWPTYVLLGKVTFRSEPPYRIKRFASLWKVHEQQFFDWLEDLPDPH